MPMPQPPRHQACAADGEILVTDALLTDTPVPTLARRVEGLSGAVAVRSLLAPRFGYGAQVPELSAIPDGCRAYAEADGLVLRTPVPLHLSDAAASARFVDRKSVV